MKRKNDNTNNVMAESVTVEALLTPRARETELIHLPRAEYERLIRNEENFSRVCNLLKDNDLSPYTIGEVVKALFPEFAPAKEQQTGDASTPESEAADA